MNKAIIVNLLIIIAITNYSCSKKKIGDWDDIIKLSTKEVEFNSTADSVIITTEGSWWWITDISVDGKYYYDFTGIDLQANSYSIKQDCFNVEKRDNKTLFIKLDGNPLIVNRIITIGLEAGDYFDRITITQKPK